MATKDLEKLPKIPVPSDPTKEGFVDDTSLPSAANQKGIDEADSNFYFQVKPSGKPIKVKSSVVLPLPLYNADAQKNIKMTPFGGIGLGENFSLHDGSPLSFEYIYQNFNTEDFAQLLVSSGMISKAIKYALLYNYFGFPIANYSFKLDSPGEVSDSNFTKYNNIAKRCLGLDMNLAQEMNVSGQITKSQLDNTIAKKSYFTDYVKGIYQFGDMGILPPFNSEKWTGEPQEIDYVDYIKPSSDFTNYLVDNVPNGEDLAQKFNPPPLNIFRGMRNHDPSYVEPIGVDAQYAGFSAHSYMSGLVSHKGSSLSSIFFNPSWSVPTNNIDKTYARAWAPSIVQGHLYYGVTSFEGLVESGEGSGIDIYGPQYGQSTKDVHFNSLWLQTTTNVYGDSGDVFGYFDSMSYIVGYPFGTPPTISQGFAAINNPYAEAFGQNESWYHSLTYGDHAPVSFDDHEKIFNLAPREKFQVSNIASMYKLVPSGIQTKSELDSYRVDPAKTLNVIWPSIWDYVYRITPEQMFQIVSDNYSGNSPITDLASKSSPLNNSDIITKAKKSYTPHDWVRKFRIGHQLTPRKPSTDYLFGENNPLESPVPSIEQGPELGFTHTVGANEESGFHLMAGYAKLSPTTNPTTQTLEQRTYRNKLSVNFKTDFHRSYFFDPSYKGYNAKYASTAINNSLIESAANYQTTQFLFPKLENVFIGKNFNNFLNAGGVKAGFDESNELDYSYFLSSKILGYLYLKKPAGFDGRLPSELDNEGSDSAMFAIEFDNDTWENNQHGSVFLPTTLNLTSLSNLTDLLLGQTKLDPVKLNIQKSIGVVEQFEIEWMASVGSLGEDVGDFLGITNPGAPIEDGPDFLLNKQSNFALPVWHYDEGTEWDLKNIQWGKLSDSPKKLEKLEQAGTLLEIPGIENLTNYGVPSWVKSLRIYPSPDNQIIPTNPNAYAIKGLQGDGINVNPILPSFKESEPRDSASAALKIVLEPKTTSTTDDYGLEIAQGTNSAGDRFHRHVEVRYVVELEIDEKELILDMAGQGVFSLDGTIEEYENIGFDLEDILEKTKGNVTSDDILEELENGNYDFGISGDGTVDFGSLPGAFPDSEVETSCTIFATDELANRADVIMQTNPANVEDYWKCTSYLCLKDIGQPTYMLKKEPGQLADNIGYLDDGTIVKVLKEWVNGKGQYNKVLIVDDKSPYFLEEGYLPPDLLKPLFPNLIEKYKNSNLFFEQKFENLSLSQTEKLDMSEMAKALIPTWYKLEEPYYHREDIEHWVSVELPYECIIDDDDYEAKKQEAVIKGIMQLFDFYNKNYSDQDVLTLSQTYLAARAEEAYIDSRPGSNIKILVKIGGIYLNAFSDKKKTLASLKSNSARILSLDTRYYQTHIQHAIFSLNKIYLDIFTSKFVVPGLDLEKEAQRLSFVPVALKKILAVNGFATINEDRKNIINIGFDETYNVRFISYIEDASEAGENTEELLTIGFDLYKEQEPFNFKNTMSLLFHHREIKNPVLKWETLINEWMVSPEYKIVPRTEAGPLQIPSNNCGYKYFDLPSLSEIMMSVAQGIDLGLDLHPRYDLGAFQFNLLQFFPPCPKPAPGKGSPFYKFLSEIDGQTVDLSNGDFMEALVEESSRIQQYVGDFLSSGAALRDIRSKIFDLDDLYTYVLNYITPEALYSKICKCFISLVGLEDIPIPNLEISAEGGTGGLNLNPATVLNNPSNVFDSEGAKFNTNFVDKDGNFKSKKEFEEKLAAEDLFCSFCFNIPSVFFRLPTTNLLDTLIQALKAALEFALAQILLQLIAGLLDALLTCPELNCPSNQGGVKDYGAQSLEDLAPNGIQSFDECGLVIDGSSVTEEMVSSMLEECSISLTSSEVLGLYDGSATKESLQVVVKIINNYPQIASKIGDISQIATLFSCVGSKIDPKNLESLADQVSNIVNDKVLCQELKIDAEQAILDKCGSISSAVDLATKALNPDFQKYVNIAKIIRDNDNLSNQLPPLFSDGKGGQALMSGMASDSTDHALEQALETLSIPVESTLINESKILVNSKNNIYVKGDDTVESLTSLTPMIALFPGLAAGPGALNPGDDVVYHNNLGGLKVFDSNKPITIDVFMKSLASGLGFDGNNANASETKIIKADLTDGDYVHWLFSAPYDNDNDGVLDYNDSYKYVIKTTNGISTTIDGTPAALSDDILAHLNKFSLKSNGNPEQAQYFSNLILSNILNSDQIPIFDNGSSFDMLEKELQSNVYFGTLISSLSKMGQVVSNSKLIEKYDTQHFVPVFDNNFAIATVQIILNLPILVSLSPYLPILKRVQLEKFSLIDNSTSGIPRSFVDFEYGIELAKKEYDFSRYYNPNSPSIGMPQMAMMESVISNMLQTFVGDVLMRGIFILPFFPKELFLNDVFAKFVLAHFKAYLFSSKSGSMGTKFPALIMRMLYDKPEFTPNPNSQKPLLPGETQDIQSLIDQAENPLNPFGGKLYDSYYGREFEINNWLDATLHYIRKNMERPVSYIKDRISKTKLANGVEMDQEINPFFLIIQQNIKETFEGNNLIYENVPNNLSSTLVQNGMINETKNGAFILQYYFRIEDLSSQDPQYYKHLNQRKLILVSNDPYGSEGEGWKPPGADEIIYDDNPFDGNWNPWDLGYDGYPWPGQNFEDFVGDPGSVEEYLLVAPEDPSLKSVLNRRTLYRLWQNMDVLSDNPVKGNYGIPKEEQQKAFASFFKSVKLGVRLCYVIADTNATKKVDTSEVLIIEEDGVPVNEHIKTLKKNLVGIAATDVLASGVSSALFAQQKYEKTILVTEKYPDSSGDLAGSYNNNFILPLISKEVDISEFEIFQQPVNSFNAVSTAEAIEELVQSSSFQQKRNDLIQDIFNSIEGRTLFKYSISLSKLATMLFMYNAVGVSTDKEINNSFDLTKEIIKQNFESIYDATGSEYYKYQPSYIKDKGGAKGIANNAASKAGEE